MTSMMWPSGAVTFPDGLDDMNSDVAAVHRAADALAAGGMVIVVDDVDREHEGDLIVAAESVTPEQVAFVVRHSTGILCAPMGADRAAQLRLPQMVGQNTDAHSTAFTVTVDHIDSGTGVSAADRARTFRALADPGTTPDELRRPGHVFPLRARAGGVLERRGHTEAAVDLLKLAGRTPVGLIGEIVDDDGAMMRGAALREFADEHRIPMLAIADLVSFQRRANNAVERVAESAMPTIFGDFQAIVFRSTHDDQEHLALVLGDPAAAGRTRQGALVRVHSECLTGDIVGSLRCDCGIQLEKSLEAIAAQGCGVVVYLRGQEGRGIGLGHKVRAYALQEDGLDTVDANTVQGLPIDSRTYVSAAQILTELGIHRVRLLTNNPEKCRDLHRHGLQITERVAVPVVENPHNRRYLRTKRDRMGHDLPAAI